jgi:hypothetical protein
VVADAIGVAIGVTYDHRRSFGTERVRQPLRAPPGLGLVYDDENTASDL